MSYSKYQQTYLGPKGIEQQLLNSIFTTHDMGCGCPDPPTHLLTLIAPLVKPKNLSKEEKKEIRKCLSTILKEDEDIVDDGALGDLDALFADTPGADEG